MPVASPHRAAFATIIAVGLSLAGGLGPGAATARADDGAAFFERHIRPLLAERCYSCHSQRSGQREGGLLLDSRAGWQAGGENGAAIVPGRPQKSRLMAAVQYDDPDLRMPPDRALDAKDVALLERWIGLGAPDPRAGPSPAVSPRPSDPVAGRQHWAFQPWDATPPAAPPPAEGSDELQQAARPQSPIDRYVLARLRDQGLRPARAAERRTLVRRLYLLLTGLPPQSDELAAALADRRPGGYQRLVDRLLASPEFGRRWGRHWLDLARYADSNGLDENFLFREAWRYRNWVIDAVNGDLPYDQFLRQQLAGDLLPFASVAERDRQRIAAGFLLMGPKVLLGNDPRERRMDVADELIDTVGRAVLGQTLGCARCHDHKFDPIPTADYYALAGIFTSTQVMERRHMLGQQRTMERLAGLGADGGQADDSYEAYWRQLPALKQRLERAKSAAALLKKDDGEGLQELLGKHDDAVAAGARDQAADAASRQAAQQALIDELASRVAQPPAIPPRAMIPVDESPADEKIRLAGQFDQLGDSVERGFLRVVGSEGHRIAEDASGRLELSEWLVDTQHGAGQLAARVMANRIWMHLIGRGLVRTVDNFGRTGEPPSHPRLLDHLAGELVRRDWSVKALVREIVLSRTFQMSSAHDPQAHAIDPENRWLWRANRRRLDPESFRDAMLSAAGALDRNSMDSTVWYLGDQATAVGANKNRRRTDFPCRSVYLPVIRNDLPELFDVFDFADPHATTGMRPQTLVATQGLFVLNDELVAKAARGAARRILRNHPQADDPRLADVVIGEILQREPGREQRESILRFVRQSREMLRSEASKQESKAAGDLKEDVWSLACHAVFASSPFQIFD